MKRLFDLAFSLLGLIALSPVLAVLAIVIKVSDGGAVLFRQERVGQRGKRFRILKFRSMVKDAEDMGLSVTKDGDPRIIPIGRFMRRFKLDELPQLWNVLVGDMSFVGPRPEVPTYVEKYTDAQKRILELKPGITDPATLEFRNEAELLSKSGDTERFYLHECMPRKIELSLAYAERANLWTDVGVIVRTVLGRPLTAQETTDHRLQTTDLPEKTRVPSP